MNIPRKRSGSGSKKSKEKYDVLLKNTDENEELTENVLNEIINSSNAINLEVLELDVSKINFDNAVVVKRNFGLLLKLCVRNLIDDGEYFIEFLKFFD